MADLNIYTVACHDVYCLWEGERWPDTKRCPDCDGPVYRVLDAEIEDMLRYGKRRGLQHAVTFLREAWATVPAE